MLHRPKTMPKAQQRKHYGGVEAALSMAPLRPRCSLKPIAQFNVHSRRVQPRSDFAKAGHAAGELLAPDGLRAFPLLPRCSRYASSSARVRLTCSLLPRSPKACAAAPSELFEATTLDNSSCRMTSLAILSLSASCLSILGGEGSMQRRARMTGFFKISCPLRPVAPKLFCVASEGFAASGFHQKSVSCEVNKFFIRGEVLFIRTGDLLNQYRLGSLMFY